MSRLTQTSPADADPHTDTHQNGASEAKEDTTPWYLTLLKEKVGSVCRSLCLDLGGGCGK